MCDRLVIGERRNADRYSDEEWSGNRKLSYPQIENHRVKRVEFTLTSPFHSAAGVSTTLIVATHTDIHHTRKQLSSVILARKEIMQIKEFRIPLPLEMSEFRRGLLYSVSEACKSETGGGEGAEFVKQCDFFDDTTITPGKSLSGIYSYKIYKVKSKVPWVLQKLLPEEAFEIHEESWNAYPYCKTMLTNPAYMGDGSYLMIESIHLPDNGKSENPLDIPSPREIIYLDICDDVMIGEANYQPELDPKIFKSTKTGRGQLRENWMETSSPIMCAYKVVTAQFKCMGLGGFIESTIMKQYSKIFANFHRNAFCWIDSWYDLTDEELQKFDEETALLLHKLLHTDERRGVMFDD